MKTRKIFTSLLTILFLTLIFSPANARSTNKNSKAKKSITNSKTKQDVIRHLDFMGVPINGTISEFTSKLTNKGFKTTPNSLPVGVKTYSGRYFDNSAELFVYYIPNSKLVYRVKVVIGTYSESQCENLMLGILSALDRKYEENDVEQGEYEDRTAFSMSVYDEGNGVLFSSEDEEVQVWFPTIGGIDLFISYELYSYDCDYRLFIDFYDAENYGKYIEWRDSNI